MSHHLLFQGRQKGPCLSALSGLTVLVVEDDFFVGEMTAETLRGFGCRVGEVAATPGAALAMIDADKPDVAVLDVNLGHGTTSVPVASALRGLGIPFVFVTAYGRDILPPFLRDAPLVRKPWADQQLGEALAAVMSSV